MLLDPQAWEGDLLAAVTGLRMRGPGDLLKRVNVDREDNNLVTPTDLIEFLNGHNQQDNGAVQQLAMALAAWDIEDSPTWDSEQPTPPRTPERRAKVYGQLKLPEAAARRLDAIAPVATIRNTVISTRWTPWYTDERRARSAFYWPHYSRYLLETRNWPAESVAALDQATTEVVQRLSDPSANDSYQSKGLVIGYVQSGKTANFTGVVAKAIDAGYRLVIVMTGTIELLRSQTQRRLDRELVGRENLIRGIADTSATDEFDYAADDDWKNGAFIEHGDNFLDLGYPGIERLTLLHEDYKRLKQGLTRMRFEPRNRSKPFFDPENLLPADARLLVVKKNSTVLRKLAKDLKPLKEKLAEIPALIIDDESDLASINTKDPKKTKERTAINRAISELLQHLKRAQLVMYTATPFANFFVDPDDPADIFPKNFIVALDRPPGYMGVTDFHDLGWNSEDDKTDPAKSNEAAFVRPIGPPPDHDDPGARQTRLAEIQLALDSFVLAGAIKVYRENQGVKRYRHHTMLVHEATQREAHRELAEQVRAIWAKGAYGGPAALNRLKHLWVTDFRPVCQARSEKNPTPVNFDELIEPIGEACRRIREIGDPVLVVNSDKDVQANQQALDFDRNEVWRILIGGAKLSRGFTVEGLTVSFYTRKALQGDTLMQAGRWFGFRQGYRDLVRLFIRRDPPSLSKPVDLYEAFEGLMLDEEALRERLRDYEGFQDDGTPILEPWQVPPVVSQHLPYLRPTGRTKMFNAVIDLAGDAGKLKDYYGLPARADKQAKLHNYYLMLPLLKLATRDAKFVSRSKPEDTPTSFTALIGDVPAEEFLTTLKALHWHGDYEHVISPTLRFFEKLVRGGQLTHMSIVWPQLLKSVATRELPEFRSAQVVTRRRRQSPRIDFVGSDSKHRNALERIAGADTHTVDPIADSMRDPKGRRGSILLYVAADPASESQEKPCPAGDLPAYPDPHDLAVLMSLTAPAKATAHGKAVINWKVRRSGQHGAATVDL